MFRLTIVVKVVKPNAHRYRHTHTHIPDNVYKLNTLQIHLYVLYICMVCMYICIVFALCIKRTTKLSYRFANANRFPASLFWCCYCCYSCIEIMITCNFKTRCTNFMFYIKLCIRKLSRVKLKIK